MDEDMQDVGQVVPGEYGNRPVIRGNGQTRVALPMAYVEVCATQTEQDFLWRFFEASTFAEGETKVIDAEGNPMGRYTDYAEQISPDQYVRLEVQAFKWVKQYGLGREWSIWAEMFLRMMMDRAEISTVDWGGFLTNSDDERVSLGGAQVSLRALALRLKDAYRDFFRWYRYVQECEAKGIEPDGRGALMRIHRERAIATQLEDWKDAHRRANGGD